MHFLNWTTVKLIMKSMALFFLMVILSACNSEVVEYREVLVAQSGEKIPLLNPGEVADVTTTKTRC